MFVFAAFLFLAGCGPKIGVEPVKIDERFENISRSALTSDALSETTRLFLRQRHLDGDWKKNPKKTLSLLVESAGGEPQKDTAFALMELCFARFKKTEKLSPRALELSISCAYYAYAYLFGEKAEQKPSPYQPHSRLACEFYNRAISEILVHFRDTALRYKPGMKLPMVNRKLKLEPGIFQLGWDPGDFDRFYVAYEFEPKGLYDHIRTFGLGVPLVAVRVPETIEKIRKEDRFLPKMEQTYAATFLLRFTGFSEDGDFETAEFDLYNPLETYAVKIGNEMVALETDFTTPLAYMVGKTRIPGGISGLMDVASWEDFKGLHMLQPFNPKKIPVVFVHGLMSSPETWLPMFNNLLADETIREKYQFWFFMYPTGNPIIYSASVLRESLEEVRSFYDPEGKSPAFNRMVLVGHSMGGLLSKMMIMRSGDAVWRKITDVPFENFEIDPEQRATVRRTLFFEPVSSVSRVVFIATPHRGSQMALKRIGQIGIRLVKLPFDLVQKTFEIFLQLDRDENTKIKYKLKRLPTGIDGLKPGSFFVEITNEIAMLANIPYHSIIGNNKAANVPGGTDGVVPYESSHLDGAVSEKIVRSGHSVHRHPLAIREVRRILLENWESPLAWRHWDAGKEKR